MADIARITEVIEPEVKALGFELVRVKIIGSEAGATEDGSDRALQIMAEDPATGQLRIDQCAELSHRISDVIDAREEAGEVLVEGSYRLEVSSPGIDRPLTRLKDYAEWSGHEAKITLAEKVNGLRDLRGDLAGLDGETVTIIDRKHGELRFPVSAVHSAKLVLTDRLLAATMPLDASGADELFEEEEG